MGHPTLDMIKILNIKTEDGFFVSSLRLVAVIHFNQLISLQIYIIYKACSMHREDRYWCIKCITIVC